MIKLPEVFLKRMQVMLDDEYDAFYQTITEGKPTRGLRINTRKIRREAFLNSFITPLTKIPFDDAFYYIPHHWLLGNHPYFHAGGMYIQEPSAALPALAPTIKEDFKVLDLCAAPGGKTSQILPKLKRGFLVANEINYQRAKILASNLERLGFPNVIVTNNKPEDFLVNFEDYFDLVMVDAPCSGEGMFRKDEEAINNWSLDNVDLFARRQKGILKVASKLVKPGGQIVYSTCTFSMEENEKVIEWFLEEHPNFKLGVASKLVQQNTSPALANLENARRIWPHKNIGEGHFIALLERSADFAKIKGYSVANYLPKISKAVKNSIVNEIEQILDLRVEELNIDNLYQINENYHWLPFSIPPLNNVKVMLAGVKLGSFNKQRRFFIDHQLSHSFPLTSYKNVLNFNLNDQEVRDYLAGYEIKIIDKVRDTFNDMSKEYVVIAVDGMVLGFGKNVNGTVKNYYPKGLRNLVKSFEKY